MGGSSECCRLLSAQISLRNYRRLLAESQITFPKLEHGRVPAGLRRPAGLGDPSVSLRLREMEPKSEQGTPLQAPGSSVDAGRSFIYIS